MTHHARPGVPGLSGEGLEVFLGHVNTINGGGPLTTERRAELMAKLARAGQLEGCQETAPGVDAAGRRARTAVAPHTDMSTGPILYGAALPGLPYSTEALDHILVYRAHGDHALAPPLDKAKRRVLVWKLMSTPMDIETALQEAGW